MNLDTFLARRNSNYVKSHEEKDEPSIQLTIDPATSINLLNRVPSKRRINISNLFERTNVFPFRLPRSFAKGT